MFLCPPLNAAESSFEVTLACKKEAEGIAELYLDWLLLCGNESAMVSFKLEKACSKGMHISVFVSTCNRYSPYISLYTSNYVITWLSQLP